MSEGNVLDAPTDSSVPDVSTESSQDAPTLAVTDGGGDAVDASCASCDAPNLCRQGVCRTAFQIGPYGGDDAGYSLQTSDTAWCVQIRGRICGQVTQVSALFAVVVTASVRLAVYDDNAGTPSSLLSQSREVLANGASVDGYLDPAITIDCGAPKPAVWVCLASSANGVELRSIVNSASMWTSITIGPKERAGWLASGFPGACWSGRQSTSVTPLIYLWEVN